MSSSLAWKELCPRLLRDAYAPTHVDVGQVTSTFDTAYEVPHVARFGS